MSKTVILVVPEAPPVQAAAGASKRRLSAEGVRLGILDQLAKEADVVISAMAD